MTDSFVIKNNRDRAKEITDQRKAAESEATNAAKQRMADAKKPKFNDLPKFKPRWNI